MTTSVMIRNLRLVFMLGVGLHLAGAGPVPGGSLQPVLRDSLGGPARTAFVRSERIYLAFPDSARTQTLTRLNGRVRVRDADGTVIRETPFSLIRPDRDGAPHQMILDSTAWRVGEYTAEIGMDSEPDPFQTNLVFWICPEPDRRGFVFGMLDEQIRRGPVLRDHLNELRSLGFSAVMHYQPTPELMEMGLRHGMNGMGLLHGQAGDGGFREDRAATFRLNARGVPFESDPQKPGSGRWGIAHPGWQVAVARQMEVQTRKWAAYPGFWPMIHTSDDFYRWTGLDYHPSNVATFAARYGIDPPRPPEALATDYPLHVARPTGIIPDNDPWVLWQSFNAREVLGHYNGLLAEAVRKATRGSGRIGPVCGGGPWTLGTIPLVDLPSGQWPPYNFGPGGFSLISYYNYNCYWFPAMAQVWWAELARMGNRTTPVWVMPDTMDLRRTYHLQNLHLFLAGGVDGLIYFIYEWASPGWRAAIQQVGPEIAAVKDLLGELKPVPRRWGLLMPFETACFRASHPADAAYAFANLAMAHADVEPVWPEEIPARGRDYRGVLLYDVDWLTEANAARLREYQRKGGRVMADADSDVDWPGLERLDFALARPIRDGGYGDTQLIARIRAVTDALEPPWAQSDDPHVLLRHMRLDGVDYLWVVHLMNQAEDRAHLHTTPGREFKVPALDAYADYDRRRYAAQCSVPTGSFQMVADVLGRHPPVEIRDMGQRRELRLALPGWQGRLLAFYPSRPDEVRIELATPVRRGKTQDCRIEIRAQGRPVTMSLPLTIEFLDPDGKIHPEFSRTVLARQGRVRFFVNWARNERPGEWILIVREATTGVAGEKRFSVP